MWKTQILEDVPRKPTTESGYIYRSSYQSIFLRPLYLSFSPQNGLYLPIYVLLIPFTHYYMAHEVSFGTAFMLSLEYSISFSEGISDNVLANAITSIFWTRRLVCLKDTAPPWSERATTFQQGLQSSLSSGHKSEAGRHFPGLWFTWKSVSVTWPKLQDLHKSTHS